MRFLLLFLTLFAPCFGDDGDDYGNDYFGDYIMPLAAAAYSDNPQQCLTNIQYHHYGHEPYYNIPLYRKYSIKCASINDTCTGYTAVDCMFHTIIIGFAGTTKYEGFFQGGGLNYSEMIPFVGGGKVNKQFFNAFNTIWINAGMKDDVITLKNKLGGGEIPFRFYFVGHSIGGAMASIAAATLVSTGITTSDNIFVITFGQPRTGDKDYADAFNEMLNGYAYMLSLRVVHNRDIVPHLPPLNSSSYYHHLHEIWFPNDMGINDTNTECSDYDGEDSKCSNSLTETTLNFDDHKYYCGRDFSDFGVKGCIFNSTSTKIAKMRQKLFKNRAKIMQNQRKNVIGPNAKNQICPDNDRFL